MAGPFNEFHVISGVANGACNAYRFGRIDSAQKIVQCVAGDIPDGIIKFTVADGDMATLVYDGQPLIVEAAASQTAGTEVGPDANGRAILSGAAAAGRIFTNSTNAGDQVAIQLYRRARLGVSAAGTPATALAVNGAIPVRPSANYTITKAGILADTLAAPTSGADDGTTLIVTSTTAFAHTITATGLLNTGSAAVNVATFGAFAGATVTFIALAGKWNVSNVVGVTFT